MCNLPPIKLEMDYQDQKTEDLLEKKQSYFGVLHHWSEDGWGGSNQFLSPCDLSETHLQCCDLRDAWFKVRVMEIPAMQRGRVQVRDGALQQTESLLQQSGFGIECLKRKKCGDEIHVT